MENSWLNLKDKVVVVTGGSCGIGKSIVQEFLNMGSKVIICDLIEPDFDKNMGEFIYIKTDVSKFESVNEAFSISNQKYGKIDILVNNAGINIPCLLIDYKTERSIYELNDAIYDKVMGVNVKGVYLCSQIFGREMVKNNKGVIINVSSESGLEGSEGQSIYAATKNAVNSFTRSWAKELGKKGVRVVGIAPGILEETNLRTLQYEEALAYTRNITIDELRQGYNKISTIPLGRVGKLSEVADFVCFLASDRASYIHGVTLNIAGGKTRG